VTEAPGSPRRVYFGLGSNLGDRSARLREAVEGLRAGGVAIDAISGLYRTPPWGVTDQPDFLNAVVAGETALAATELLRLAKRIEADAGRDFDAPRWTARPIDVDILIIEGETISTDELQVPHPLLHQRAFVLVPLADLTGERDAVEQIAGAEWVEAGWSQTN
jgi:2-amino-4-hydroxy-6-hydroxymethyldihydropteridine diphosphokinase